MWWCDDCGERIEKVEDGWVEWLRSDTSSEFPPPSKGLRLVHHQIVEIGCSYDERAERERGWDVADGALSRYVGPSGLVALLSLNHLYKFPQGELENMIARLHVPGFEDARHFVGRAYEDGAIQRPTLPFDLLDEQDIEAVMAWAREAGELEGA